MNALPKAGDLYPWTLHKSGAQTKTVWNEDEKAAAEADGWCVAPPDQQPADAPAPAEEPEPKSKPRRRK